MKSSNGLGHALEPHARLAHLLLHARILSHSSRILRPDGQANRATAIGASGESPKTSREPCTLRTSNCAEIDPISGLPCGLRRVTVVRTVVDRTGPPESHQGDEMASTDTVTEAGDQQQGPAGAGEAAPVAALQPHGRLRRPRRPDHRPRRGLLRLRRPRQALPRRALGAVLRQRRTRPRPSSRTRLPRQIARARLLHHLELRPPAGDRARRADRRARPRRPQPGLLHLRRLGGGRVGAQARARLPPAAPATRARSSSSPARSPTTAPPSARSAATGIPALRTDFEPLVPGGMHVAEHERYHWPEDRDPLWAADADRGADRLRGARDGRRGDPRAGAERRRLLPSRRTATSSACARSATATTCC